MTTRCSLCIEQNRGLWPITEVAVEARYEEDGAARDRKDDDEVFFPSVPYLLVPRGSLHCVLSGGMAPMATTLRA